MSRVLHKSNPYDPSRSEKFPIHDHRLYSTTDHGQCAGCFEGKELSAEFLECPICDIFFHKECIESKEEITHPFHPQHSLWLVKRESLPDTNLDRKCCLCGEELMLLVYHCLKCDFKLDMSCAKNPPLLEIDKPEVHQHSLHFLMKKVSFTCDACGLEGDRSPYLCLLCNFMFHIRCVYFPDDPRRINGLDHDSLIPGIWYCGCGSVHSDVVACENLKEEKVFEVVKLDQEAPDYIYHFTHAHILTFHKDGQVDDVYSRCDMCQLPVASTPYYCCMMCRFFLHERCVKLHPMMMTSMLHNHPLYLEGLKSTPDTPFHEKYFSCNACGQFNDGVKYTCYNDYNLDVGCASISLPFKSPAHQHPLTFISTNKKKCGICQLWASPVLSCGECDFCLGFDCAQLPVLARHKYDKHVLTLDITRDENRRDDYWCEICEKKVDMNEVFTLVMKTLAAPLFTLIV